MEIIIKNIENRVPFGDLETGSIFKSEECFFMKIYSDYSDLEDSDNAVSLNNGFCNYFDEYDTVIPINNAKIVIGD